MLFTWTAPITPSEFCGVSVFPYYSFNSTISPHSSRLLSFISSEPVTVRQAWSAGILAIHCPSITGFMASHPSTRPCVGPELSCWHVIFLVCVCVCVCVPTYIAYNFNQQHNISNSLRPIYKYHSVHAVFFNLKSLSECSIKGMSFTANSGTKVFHRKLGNQGCSFTRDE